jgi:hypothetical protein
VRDVRSRQNRTVCVSNLVPWTPPPQVPGADPEDANMTPCNHPAYEHRQDEIWYGMAFALARAHIHVPYWVFRQREHGYFPLRAAQWIL